MPERSVGSGTERLRARMTRTSPWLKPLNALSAASLLAPLLCYVPAAYGTSSYLPGRARIVPQFVFVCVTAGWGYLAGATLSKSLNARRRLISGTVTAGSIAVASLLLLPSASRPGTP